MTSEQSKAQERCENSLDEFDSCMDGVSNEANRVPPEYDLQFPEKAKSSLFEKLQVRLKIRSRACTRWYVRGSLRFLVVLEDCFDLDLVIFLLRVIHRQDLHEEVSRVHKHRAYEPN